MNAKHKHHQEIGWDKSDKQSLTASQIDARWKQKSFYTLVATRLYGSQCLFSDFCLAPRKSSDSWKVLNGADKFWRSKIKCYDAIPSLNHKQRNFEELITFVDTLHLVQFSMKYKTSFHIARLAIRRQWTCPLKLLWLITNKSRLIKLNHAFVRICVRHRTTKSDFSLVYLIVRDFNELASSETSLLVSANDRKTKFARDVIAETAFFLDRAFYTSNTCTWSNHY